MYGGSTESFNDRAGEFASSIEEIVYENLSRRGGVHERADIGEEVLIIMQGAMDRAALERNPIYTDKSQVDQAFRNIIENVRYRLNSPDCYES